MRTALRSLVATAAVLVGAAGAQAATVYNQNVADPGPGWINGSGNPNGGFAVTADNGVEVGMRAKYRHNPSVIASTDGVYTVVAGPQTAATSGGPAFANRAAWNYEFSIYLTDGLTLGDILAELTITNPDGDSTTVNPLTHWADNTGYAGSLKQQPAQSNSVLAQNSQNAAFGDFPLTLAGHPYNMWETGTYQFDLKVSDSSGNLLAATSIDVNVVPVPLPSSAWGGLAMMAVAGGVVLRKRLQGEQAI